MKSLWKQSAANKAKDKVDLLVYSSRLIGSEPKLCVWGGGNTSTKVTGKNHLGKTVRILHIKGSGSDLKVSKRTDYPPVALDELLEALKFESMTDEAMVDYVSKCLLEPKAPRPSIEVLLHAFVDQPDIHHTHADAILSITNTKNNKSIARKIYGDELLWVPYIKPGFTLAKWVAKAYQKNPSAKGMILEKHGLITWGPDAKISYARTIEMVTRAEKYLAKARAKKKRWSRAKSKTLTSSLKQQWLFKNMPVIRRSLSAFDKVVLNFCDAPDVMDFVNAADTAAVSQLGPATPDHMLRTKRMPLVLDFNGASGGEITDQKLTKQIKDYAKSHERYFNKYKKFLPKNGTTRMLDPYPKVILIPGIGMITSGKDLKSAKIVEEIYRHSISVMTSAETIDSYESLSEKLAFEMDYWPMELYKLSLAPPEAEFSRQIGLVTGAARGIGRAIARNLAKNGAHVFLADFNEKAIKAAAEEINKEVKAERAFPVFMDVTKPASVKKAFEKLVLKFGGIDFLVSNAGIAHVSSVDKIGIKDWDKSMAVNATGHFLVAKEAVLILKRQDLGGSLVFIASKNVLAPGKDFGAYSAAKAAEAQLARILAIENGEHHIRVNMINPDGIFEDSGLWDTIRSNRARTYGIAPKKLETFYQARNLMKIKVLPEDVAESVEFLLSKKASKTTGCILTVDGGVKEAFPR